MGMGSKAALLILGATLGAQPPPEGPRVYAIVVGNNTSIDPGVAPLHYADDDAARYFELLAPQAHRAVLLTVLDAESQAVFPELAQRALAPTRTALLEQLQQTNAEMEQDRLAGLEPILYFIFVGHGQGGVGQEGYVSLLDGRFTRSDLFHEVIAPSRATYNHVVIDACDSYFMVAARGDDSGPDVRQAVKDYVGMEQLARYPNTGVLLATSSEKETHEWSRFGGGVFSQEVRSALTGAADVNGDGRIEYSEVKAFVAASNLGVTDPRARLEIFARPPALNAHAPLIDLAGGYRHFLRVPASRAERFYLEDARGVRYADFYPAPGGAVSIALVPSAYYFLRGAETEAKIDLDQAGTTDSSDLHWRPIALAARGSISLTFEHNLFSTPFGAAFYQGYVASTGDAVVGPGNRSFPLGDLALPPLNPLPLKPSPY